MFLKAYREVVHAWVVVDANGVSRLYINFADEWEDQLPDKIQPDNQGLAAILHVNGMVSTKTYNAAGSGYRTYAHTVSEELGVPCVEVNELHKDYDPIRIITQDFAEHILNKFELPFTYVTLNGEGLNTGTVLVATDDFMGAATDHPTYGIGTIHSKEVKRSGEYFTVTFPSGSKHLNWNDMRDIYPGIPMYRMRRIITSWRNGVELRDR